MKQEREEIPKRTTGVIFVFYKDGKVLVEDRPKSDEYFGGLSVFPGGKIDFRNGETVEEALEREIKEECGENVKIKKCFKLGDFVLIARNGRPQHPSAFLISEHEGEIENLLPDKGKQRWIPIDDYNKELVLASSLLVAERAKNILVKEGLLED